MRRCWPDRRRCQHAFRADELNRARAPGQLRGRLIERSQSVDVFFVLAPPLRREPIAREYPPISRPNDESKISQAAGRQRDRAMRLVERLKTAAVSRLRLFEKAANEGD